MMLGVRLILLLYLACCNAACEVKPMNEPPPACARLDECKKYDGKRVRVTGVYARYNPTAGRKRDTGSSRIVRLMLGDERGPYLEPYWHPATRRSENEIHRFNGKRVVVTGTFHSMQPRNPEDPPYASHMGGPCIHFVERIEVVNGN